MRKEFIFKMIKALLPGSVSILCVILAFNSLGYVLSFLTLLLGISYSVESVKYDVLKK